MKEDKRSVIVISASSDIGAAICSHWLTRGWDVFGTYRKRSQAVDELRSQRVKLISCDISDSLSVGDACSSLRALCPQWDVLVLCSGTQEPVGAFIECKFDDWEDSLRVNFAGQMRVIHELLPARSLHASISPIVLLFAGGGTNDAPPNYSAYIVSKIALIKMCELLDAEIPDTRFAIIGPGWVKTKIHEATLRAGKRAGTNYQRTVDKLAGDELTPIEQVLDCCDWLVSAPHDVIGGRNFSVVFDKWGTEELAKILTKDPNMYKLRRYGNERILKNEHR